MLLITLLIACCVAESILDVPYYFSIPKQADDLPLNCPNIPFPSFWNPSSDEKDVGLRIIAIRQEPGVKNRKRARRNMARLLAKAGTLQTGDIALTFRPQMADSMSYPHIQMGVTHAGLIFTDKVNGEPEAFNIDSPLDYQYMGQFDSSHYAGDGVKDLGTDALHIIRPENMNDEKRAQLTKWIKTLKKGIPRINGERLQIKFQSDYLLPRWAAMQTTSRATVTRLGKIILEQDRSTKLPMFCSEFAWHMLALSSCSFDDIKNAGDEASCVEMPFAPMPLTQSKKGEVGLADGPLINLLELDDPADRMHKVHEVFCTEGVYECVNGGKLSSGHRKVAKLVEPLMAGLSQVYAGRAKGAPVEMIADGAGQLNGPVPVNYSPTGFFVQSMALGERGMQYVATLLFVDDRTYQKARKIAKEQNPECRGIKPTTPRVVHETSTCIKRGEKVRAIQAHLVKEHKLEIGVDGYWGRQSLGALNKIQKKYDHEVTKCLTEEAYKIMMKQRRRRRI